MSLQVCEHYFRKGFAFKWLVVILCKYTVTFPSSSSQDIFQQMSRYFPADVEAARVLCGLNLVANEPQA